MSVADPAPPSVKLMTIESAAFVRLNPVRAATFAQDTPAGSVGGVDGSAHSTA